MKKLLTRLRRLAVGAAALALAVGWTSGARADIAYAYAAQQISNLLLTSQAGALTLAPNQTIQIGSNDSASLTGFTGVSQTDFQDTPQAYVGTPARPPENTFTKFATFTGNPAIVPAGTLPSAVTTGALGNFSRGDVAFNSPVGSLFTGTGITVANVAESYVNSVTGAANGSGNGGWTINATFVAPTTTSTTNALLINYNFANDIYSATLGVGATAQSNFSLGFTIRNAAGTIVYAVSPTAANQQTGAPPNTTPELINTGAGNVNSGTTGTPTPFFLASGATYTVTISGVEQSFVSIAAPIPEPGPLALAAVAAGLAGVAGLRRKLAR